MKTKYLYCKQESGNAKSFYFALPDPNYFWVAGQYISLSFIENDESDNNRHWFTIASAYNSKFIQITTRMSGSIYKSKLDELKDGDEVYISAPNGDFILDKPTKPVVFVAGGIGITPYHSMLSDNSNIEAHLIYVNRDDNYVFKEFLENLTNNNPNLRISYLKGQVNADVLESTNDILYDSIVYLSGPEVMVESVGDELINRGLDTTSLKRDWFPGYDDKTF